jgi:hypothetical protein
MRARIAGQRLEEVVRRVERLRLAGVLTLPAHPEQHQVAGARRELLTPEELLRAPAVEPDELEEATGIKGERLAAAVEEAKRRFGVIAEVTDTTPSPYRFTEARLPASDDDVLGPSTLGSGSRSGAPLA